MFRQRWRQLSWWKVLSCGVGLPGARAVSISLSSASHRILGSIQPLSRRKPCSTRDKHKLEGSGGWFLEPGALGGLLSASCTLGGSAERPAASCGTQRMGRPEWWGWLAAAATAWSSCRVSARGPARPVSLVCAIELTALAHALPAAAAPFSLCCFVEHYMSRFCWGGMSFGA